MPNSIPAQFGEKELEIIAIGPRENIYEETFRIISRE
jgi:hypothetical protein